MKTLTTQLMGQAGVIALILENLTIHHLELLITILQVTVPL